MKCRPHGADSLAYHPAVGVTGGLWSGGIQFGLPGDQRPDEALSLVYTSEPLDDELAILGRARADLVVEIVRVGDRIRRLPVGRRARRRPRISLPRACST